MLGTDSLATYCNMDMTTKWPTHDTRPIETRYFLHDLLPILNITVQESFFVHKILSLTRIYLRMNFMKFHKFSPQNCWLIAEYTNVYYIQMHILITADPAKIG